MSQGVNSAKAIIGSLDAEKWLTVREVCEKTGLTFCTAGRRLREMYYDKMLDRRCTTPEWGGKQHVYRLLPEGTAQAIVQDDIVYEPRALAEALGGLTFNPPRFANKTPRVRHQLR